MTDAERLREALRQIAELAQAATKEEGSTKEGETTAAAGGGTDACTLRFLPPRLLVKAAEMAQKINPFNAPVLGPVAALGGGAAIDKMRISVLTSKYWGPSSRQLSVSFMESAPSDLRARILAHMNAWSSVCSISFAETQGVGDIRISRGPGGYYSYLGTDVQLIPKNQQTMNLEGFTMSTPDSEYLRVVRHETGHTLGFPHEHMRKDLVARIDPAKAYPYFLATQGWDKETVDQQVLTPLDSASIFGTPADQTSIMCYQLPGTITRDGKPIKGGADINTTDYAFSAFIYPKLFFFQPRATEEKRELAPAMASEYAPHNGGAQYAKDWGAAQDPELPM